MQAAPISPEKAREMLAYLTSVAEEGFVSRSFRNRRFEPRRSLSLTMGKEIRFITTPVIEELCRNCSVSFDDLCQSGLMIGRIVTEGRKPRPIEEQQSIVRECNVDMKTLVFGEPMQDQHGKPLSADLYAGDVVAPIIGFQDAPRPIGHDKVQDDLHYLERTDSLFFDASRLKELAGLRGLTASPAVGSAARG